MDLLIKYLNNSDIELIKDNYASDYIENVSKSEFAEDNIKMLLNYKLFFIGDILYYYLNILDIPTKKLEMKLNLLVNTLGDNYVDIINNNIEILNCIV